MNTLWVAEYSPTHDRDGCFPWHIGTLQDHLMSNVRQLMEGNGFRNDWYMVGGPFESNDDAAVYLDALRRRIGWSRDESH